MRQTRCMSLFSHPFKKLTLAAAFGIGYTLGAKAGRERYEQIKSTAQQVKDDPRVQDAAAKAEHLVRDAATTIKDDPRVQDAVQRAETLVGDAADKAKDVTADVKDAATEGDAADKAKDIASDAKDKVRDLQDQAKHKADDVKDAAQEAAHDAKPHDPRAGGGDQTVSPLLADEHVESIDEVVYSAGPDIEESIDELAPSDDKDRI